MFTKLGLQAEELGSLPTAETVKKEDSPERSVGTFRMRPLSENAIWQFEIWLPFRKHFVGLLAAGLLLAPTTVVVALVTLKDEDVLPVKLTGLPPSQLPVAVLRLTVVALFAKVVQEASAQALTVASKVVQVSGVPVNSRFR